MGPGRKLDTIAWSHIFVTNACFDPVPSVPMGTKWADVWDEEERGSALAGAVQGSISVAADLVTRVPVVQCVYACMRVCVGAAEAWAALLAIC